VPALVAVPVEALVPVPVGVLVAVPVLVVVDELLVVELVGSEASLEPDVGTVNGGAPAVLPALEPPPPQAATKPITAIAATTAARGLTALTRGVSGGLPETT
jgi:hypothetical protein